jgi:glycosyltransferase involved in cell wall biosynthesis
MPRVSIFMSSYNHAQYLRESIESVLAQSFRDFELFIVDDASTDESWSIIQEYTDKRIKALRNPVNRNDKVMMNRVIREMAAGEYIAVHHSDNAWEPGKLETQVAFLDAHAEIGAVFTRAAVVDELGGPLRDRKNFYYSVFDQPNRTRYEWLRQFFYIGNALCHPSVLIRKECYDTCGLYRLGLGQIPDLDMWARLCLRYEIHVLPEKLTRYRVPSRCGFTSAVTQASVVRYHYELLQVLEHYRALNWEDLARVFPQAEVYSHPEGCVVDYVLARLALETGNPAKQLFGLNVLFEALNDPVKVERIASLYGFSPKDFLALTAHADVFGLKNRQELKAILESPEGRAANLLRRARRRTRSAAMRLARIWTRRDI